MIRISHAHTNGWNPCKPRATWISAGLCFFRPLDNRTSQSAWFCPRCDDGGPCHSDILQQLPAAVDHISRCVRSCVTAGGREPSRIRSVQYGIVQSLRSYLWLWFMLSVWGKFLTTRQQRCEVSRPLTTVNSPPRIPLRILLQVSRSQRRGRLRELKCAAHTDLKH